MSPLRRLLGLARPVRGWLLLAVLASFGALAANIALMTAAPYLLSKAALVRGFAALSLTVAAVRAFAIARAALRYADRYTSHLTALRILTQLRVTLFRAIEPLAPGGLDPFRSGDLLARTVADVDTLDAFFVRGVVPSVAAAVAGAFAVGVLGVLDVRLGVVLLVFLLLAGVALPITAVRRSRGPADRLVAARAELHATLADDIPGLADLMAFGREDELRDRVRGLSRAIGREQRLLAAIRGSNVAAGTWLSGLAGLAVLAIAIPSVGGGQLRGVFLAAVPLVAFAAFEGVLSLGDAFGHVEVSRAAAARTFELVDTPPVVVEPAHPLPPPADTSVELRRVRFRYAPALPPVLDGMSFRVPAGGRLAIAGPSGSGKTTIVGLLLRFVEAEAGSVRVGVDDVRDHRADDVRALIGVVPQELYLFNGTLRDNLLLADGDADDEAIAAACERAQLGDLLEGLPSGLDTLVGEDGFKLSGGERQRVGVARLLLKDAPIAILDEATAHLDVETERAVLRELDAFGAGRTMLIASHRPAALELAETRLTLPARAG